MTAQKQHHNNQFPPKAQQFEIKRLEEEIKLLRSQGQKLQQSLSQKKELLKREEIIALQQHQEHLL